MAEQPVVRRVLISGRVQGVWFRGWTVKQARSLGVLGWVRNLRNGSVEALFAGPAESVEAMIAACQDGPPAARVDAVQAISADVRDLDGLGDVFEQRETE